MDKGRIERQMDSYEPAVKKQNYGNVLCLYIMEKIGWSIYRLRPQESLLVQQQKSLQYHRSPPRNQFEQERLSTKNRGQEPARALPLQLRQGEKNPVQAVPVPEHKALAREALSIRLRAQHHHPYGVRGGQDHLANYTEESWQITGQRKKTWRLTRRE